MALTKVIAYDPEEIGVKRRNIGVQSGMKNVRFCFIDFISILIKERRMMKEKIQNA